MNNRKQNKQPLFAEVNLTGDEFQKSPDTFFDVCKVKGKNPKRWLAYVLDHIGSSEDEDLYKLNIIHSTIISAQWGAQQIYI